MSTPARKLFGRIQGALAPKKRNIRALENSGAEQTGIQSQNSLFSSNIGRRSEVGHFNPKFARTGESLTTTTAADEVISHVSSAQEVVFRRDGDGVWSLHETDEGIFLRNLTTNDPGSRVIIARDFESLRDRVRQLETRVNR